MGDPKVLNNRFRMSEFNRLWHSGVPSPTRKKSPDKKLRFQGSSPGRLSAAHHRASHASMAIQSMGAAEHGSQYTRSRRDSRNGDSPMMLRADLPASAMRMNREMDDIRLQEPYEVPEDPEKIIYQVE